MERYSSSIYSQKSTVSAKSGRSLYSIVSQRIPSIHSQSDDNESVTREMASRLWSGFKCWMPLARTSNKKEESNTSTYTRSSTTSLNKLKLLFILPTKHKADKHKLSEYLPNTDSSMRSTKAIDSSIESFIDRPSPTAAPPGILISRGDESAEAMAELKRRRSKRKQHILQLQNHNKLFHVHHSQYHEETDTEKSPSTDDTTSTDQSFDHQSNSSFDNNFLSAHTIIDRSFTPPFPQKKKPLVTFYDDNGQCEEDEQIFDPRIIFIEPSPIPRFRNVAPPPPPSPPYMNIQINDGSNLEDNKQGSIETFHNPFSSTLFTSKERMIEDSYIDLVSESLFDIPKKKHHLFFYSPFLRGQTITFSLQNLFPEDNIIVFKFLTSNSNHAFHTNRYYNGKQPAERYFVQPSAGRLTMEQSTDILLFLNQAPIMNPDEVLKDKIVIKWAVIQKNTEIEAWVNSLQDSTRRKWIDMLEDEWSDQVTLRMTSIKIRFIS